MKKLSIFLMILLLTAARSFGQGAVTFTLVTAPCDSNGVLVAHIPAGGTLPYRFYWTGGTTTGSAYHSGVHAYNDTLYHYTGGNVSVSAYDSLSSTYDTGSYHSTAPLSIAFNPVAPFCGASGTASVTVTGGTAPYSYYWIDMSTGTVAATTNPATIPSGLYGINVVDAGGCVFGTFGGYSLVDSISSTPTYSVSVTSTVASCTNGTATATIGSGGSGVAPYAYMWSNGATSSSITGLIMGSYNVTVTDALGCVAMGYAYISQTPSITVSTTPTPTTCLEDNGAAIAFGSGGMAPYSYVWGTGATTQSISGLTGGYYEVNVTDANGCIGTGYAYVSTSTPIVATYTSTASLCTSATGTATLSLTGGTPPYNDTFFTSPIQTGLTATGLAPGTYYFRVVDGVGCIRTGSVVVPPVDAMYGGFSATAALCTLSTGSLTVDVSGGVAPLTYSWAGGGTTNTISSRPAGYYSVTVTDANSCVISLTGNIPDYSPVTISSLSTPASCIFSSDGSILATAFGGTSPYTWSTSTTGASTSLSGLGTGEYWVSVTDASGCYASAYNYVGYNAAATSCYCTIKGNIYYDINDNCTRDAGEPPIHNIQVYCSGIGYTYTDDSGNYSFLVPSGTYTVTETVLSYYPLSSCQVNNIVVTASASSGCIIPVDFANSVNPIHSMHISTWDYYPPVPGNTYTQAVIISNEGTGTETNVLSGYKTDGQLLAPTISPAGNFVMDSSTWYTTTGGTALSMAAGTSQAYYMSYAVPTYVPLSTSVLFKDSVAYQAPMSNWLLDYSPWDNVNYFTTTVVSSYDPNFKVVAPKGTGPDGDITVNDSVLEYMVHFQNTGTYMAQNIMIIDTLDPNLDWATLTPVYQSAPCQIDLSTTGVVKFMFNNIDLPYLNAYTTISSSGMLTYTIKQRHGLAMGTQFKNKASIYFDYNAPIVTNTTLNTLEPPTSVANVATPGEFFTLYPNPASNNYSLKINSKSAGKAMIVVSDLTGRAVISKSVLVTSGVQTFTESTNGLSAGVYFVSITLDGALQTQKLVVLR